MKMPLPVGGNTQISVPFLNWIIICDFLFSSNSVISSYRLYSLTLVLIVVVNYV